MNEYEFKVGDTVERTVATTNGRMKKGDTATVVRVEAYYLILGEYEPSIGLVFTKSGFKVIKKKESILTIIKKNTMNFIKNATMSEEDKTLIKAGFMDESMTLTQEGSLALQFILYKETKKELVQMANQAIKEVEEA